MSSLPARIVKPCYLPSPGLIRSGRDSGFSILEGLISALILAATVGSISLLATRLWTSSRTDNTSTLAENAVASDLGWLKSYAKVWKMDTGPYDLTTTQTLTSSFTFSLNTLSYSPDKTLCATVSGLAAAFITDARSVTFTPARPYTLATGRTQLAVSGLASGLGLWRTLSTTRTGSTARNLVYLSYTLERNGSAGTAGTIDTTYGFQREVAVRIEAEAWCP